MYPHCTTLPEWATPLPVSSPLATLPVTVTTSGDIGGWGVLTRAVGVGGGRGGGGVGGGANSAPSSRSVREVRA